MVELFFIILAILAIFGGVGVISFKQPIHSAISMLLTLLSLAIIYIILNAEFVAAAQIVIYAGGILIIFLFAIMFVSVREAEKKKKWIPSGFIFSLFGLLLFISLFTFIKAATFDKPKGMLEISEKYGGNTEAVANLLYMKYLIPFEVVSIFLLVAMVGAIIMGGWGVKK